MRAGALVQALVVAIIGLLGPAISASAQPAGTLVVGLVAEPVNLDPAQVTDLNSNRVGRRVVETLVTFPEESTQVVPGLAESWTISKDGLRYTFKLRKGITFHDGTPFTAEAVKFSIERQFDPEHPFNKLGKYPFANYSFGNVKAVEVVDPSTVEFVLKEPRASFLTILTAAAASIVSPAAVKKLGADYALQPVVTGPFRYASWDRGQRVVLEKNPSYGGYPSGVSTALWVPEARSGVQSPVPMSTVIQSNLNAVGITESLQTMEWGAYLAKLRTKEQELFALSWMAGNEDPDMVMYPLLHSSQWTPAGPNRALYKNERFDELLHQARLTTEQGKRAALYREAQRILVDDPPWIFIDHEIQTAAHSKRVQGFKLHPSFDLRVETISLK